MADIDYNRVRKRWIVTWYKHGRRKRTSFTTHKIAKTFYAEKQYHEDCGRAGKVPFENITFAEAVRRYKGEYLARKSPTYYTTESRRLHALAGREDFKDIDLRLVRKDAVQSFIRLRVQEKVSEKTLHHDLLALNNLFKWALTHDPCYLEENPMAEIKIEKPTPKKRRRAATPEEVDKILRNACPCCAPVIEIMINTGLRVGELVQISKEDFNLETHFLILRHSESLRLKHHTEGKIPLSDRVEELVLSLPSGPVLQHRRRFEHHWGKIRKVAGVELCLHELRHTYITELFKHGVPANYVKSFARHRDIATTLGYAHQYDEVSLQYREAAAKSYQPRKSMELQSQNVLSDVQNDSIEKQAVDKLTKIIRTLLRTQRERETGLERVALEKIMQEDPELVAYVKRVCGKLLHDYELDWDLLEKLRS